MSWNNILAAEFLLGAVPTRDLVGRNDLKMATWLKVKISEGEGFTEHVFGYSYTTRVFQISSPILEETDEYFQTRSRKYWKMGDELEKLTEGEAKELSYFLMLWGISIEERVEILRPITLHNVYIDEGMIKFGIEFKPDEHAFIMNEIEAEKKIPKLDPKKCKLKPINEEEWLAEAKARAARGEGANLSLKQIGEE